MQIKYNFNSNSEPSDEQLHLLMLEVASSAKKKAQLSDALFHEQLQELVKKAHLTVFSAEKDSE